MSFIARGSAPNDAIYVSKKEAVRMQWEFISNWQPRKDVWSLLYAPGFLSLTSGFAGFYINRYYRSKLKLGRYGHLTSYMPVVLMPAALCGVFHRLFISSRIIISEENCAVCTETKSVLLQCALSVLYPLILSPIGAYMANNSYNVSRVPALSMNWRPFWNFHCNLSQKLMPKIPILIALNVVSAATVTYFEFKDFYFLSDTMRKIEKKIEERRI